MPRLAAATPRPRVASSWPRDRFRTVRAAELLGVVSVTDQETPEIDDDDEGEYETVPIKPKRFNGNDLAVLAAGLASNVLGALVLSVKDLEVMLAAHANYRRDEKENAEAVSKFHEELSLLPTAVR
jgi:hypothetical protein